MLGTFVKLFLLSLLYLFALFFSLVFKFLLFSLDSFLFFRPSFFDSLLHFILKFFLFILIQSLLFFSNLNLYLSLYFVSYVFDLLLSIILNLLDLSQFVLVKLFKFLAAFPIVSDLLLFQLGDYLVQFCVNDVIDCTHTNVQRYVHHLLQHCRLGSARLAH